MSSQQPAQRPDRWQRHQLAGTALRALALLVPYVASLAAIVVLSRLVPRPRGDLVICWYAGICAVSWAVLYLVQRPLGRLLPLAVLLEMALVFPDRAPSRRQLAGRAGSTRELQRLMAAPPNETAQQAAERVLTLVGALARHDHKTRGHAERVRALTDLIAERMALSERDRDRLRWAALLHDIGKLHVPADLLNKDGQLNRDEWDVIRGHPEHGARVAAPLMSWLEGWGDVIVQHHERWDGAGYPHGLRETEICLGARIVSVADAYDVMTSTRAYKKPIGHTAALRELARCSGSQFDPAVVRAMVAVPNRRLVAAIGPISWVSGLPIIGQTTAVASGVAAQTGTALGAAAVAGASAFTPAFAMSPAPHPAPTFAPAHQHHHHRNMASSTSTGTASSTAQPMSSARSAAPAAAAQHHRAQSSHQVAGPKPTHVPQSHVPQSRPPQTHAPQTHTPSPHPTGGGGGKSHASAQLK